LVPLADAGSYIGNPSAASRTQGTCRSSRWSKPGARCSSGSRHDHLRREPKRPIPNLAQLVDLWLLARNAEAARRCRHFTVADPAFVAKSGKAQYTTVRPNGRPDSRAGGIVFEVTDAELERSDAYEPEGYTRISTVLASGKVAWVYAGSSAW